MNQIKCVVVGDALVGKTSLLKSYATHKFSQEHTPTVFDNYLVDVMVNGDICHLGLFDTPSHENYDKLRPMSYNQASVILICYSVVKPSSFKSITEKWVPEIHFFAPKTPFILVGTQTDLRNELELELNTSNPKREKHEETSRKEGKKLSKELAKYCNCIGHVECSALTQRGLKTVFDEVIRSATSQQSGEKKKGKGKCYVL